MIKKPHRQSREGFVMLEVLLAVSMFAIVGTSLVVAINDIGDLTFELHRNRKLARILDSELRRTMSLPTLEEGKETKNLDELGVELETVIELIEDLETQDGEELTGMFRIIVSAYWLENGDYQSEKTETWRYGNLYRR